MGRAVQTRDTYARARFTSADVPPLEFWADQARAPLVTDLSANECLQTARAYVDAALKDAPGWRERLIVTDDSPTTQTQSPGGKGQWQGQGQGLANSRNKNKNKNKTLSAYTLHYVAAMIITGTVKSAHHIALHIMHTLACLDYAPSVLTHLRLGMKRDMIGKPQFEPAVEAFERILRRIGDGSGSGSESASSKDGLPDLAADACTLRAMMYAEEDTREGDNNALRWFRRAYEVDAAATASLKSQADVTSSPTTTTQQQQQQERKVDGGSADSSSKGNNVVDTFDPRWQWKASFALGVGAIRAKRGETAKARDMYAMASAELDTAAGYLAMATLLEQTGRAGTDEYVAALEKAATGGELRAARRLAEREWARAAQGGLSEWEKRKSQVLAEEWMAIAGVSAPAEE